MTVLPPAGTHVVGIPRSCASAWKLREDGLKRPQPSINNYLYESVIPEANSHIKPVISAQTIADLSRAARRAVQNHRNLVLKGDPRYKHFLKSNSVGRKRQRTPSGKFIQRSEVYSAPPSFGAPNGDSCASTKGPPRIVVINPSQDGSCGDHDELHVPHFSTRKGSHDQPRDESCLDFTPRSVTSLASSTTLNVTTPDIKTPELCFKVNVRTPRSAISSTDWAWVHERLASRESLAERPESSLTFIDFLDSLDVGSDEYDTDLEDDNIDVRQSLQDPTGLYRYRRVCKDRGIPPAKQVLQKLYNEKLTFRLNHRCLNSKDTFALAAALSTNTIVKKLNLASNSIDDEAAQHVFHMLQKNTTISILNMADNCLTFDDLNNFSDMMRVNSTLTHISLNKNRLGDKEALMLSESLRSNTSLQSLNLGQNKLTDAAGQAIAAALMDNDTLTSLNLSWNMLRTYAASAIGKALKVNSSLTSLDLSYNGIGDDGSALLARPLRHNTTLRFLSLAVNHIGPFGIEKLATGICGSRNKRGKKSNCVLRTLILDRNPLGRKGIIAFLRHMEKSEKLVDLSIDQVVLSEDMMPQIKQLCTSRTVSVFYEGQNELARIDSAIQSGAIFLREVLNRNRIQLHDFFSSLDPKQQGLRIDQLKRAVRSLRFTPSELEIKRFISCVNVKRTNAVHYSDIIKYNFVPATSVPQRLTTKSRKRYSISKF